MDKTYTASEILHFLRTTSTVPGQKNGRTIAEEIEFKIKLYGAERIFLSDIEDWIEKYCNEYGIDGDFEKVAEYFYNNF